MAKVQQEDHHDQIEAWILRIIRFGLFAIFLTPLIVLRNAYFPYIVPKTLYFKIVIDLLILLYIWLSWRNSAWLPKKSWLNKALIFYFVVLVVSTIISLDPIRSFWSTWERMDGTLTLLHVFALVLILPHVFNEDKWWKRFFIWQLCLALIMYLYSLAQKVGASFTFETEVSRITGTLGNAEYVAAYSLYYFFIGLMMFWWQKKSLWRWFCLAVSLLSVLILFLSGTRGAELSFIITLVLVAIGAFFMGGYKLKSLRIFGAIVLVLLAFLTIVFFNRNNNWVKNNFLISRIVGISAEESTIQTRLFSLQAGLHEFPNFWLTGVGPENYQYVFNKQFDPKFLSYSPGEVWFDRAHNMVVEMALTRGIFGLLSYLGLFVVALWQLWRLYRRKIIDQMIFIFASAALISYFLQNIAVFDALTTYLLFFTLLGYVYYLENSNNSQGLKENNAKPIGWHKYIWSSLGVLCALFSLWAFAQNVRQINGNAKIIDAFISASQDYQETINNYYAAINLGQPTTEVRLALLNYMISVANQINSQQVDPKFKQQFQADFKQALVEMQKSFPEEDYNLFVHFLLDRAYLVYMNTFKDGSVMPQALAVAQRAIQLSPNNFRPWYLLAQLDTMQGKNQEALDIFKKTAAWNPDYLETTWSLAAAYLQNNQIAPAFKEINYLLDQGYIWADPSQLISLSSYYEQKRDWPYLVIIYQQLMTKQPEEKQWVVKLAGAYAALGKTVEAKALLEQANKK